jgi:hypothetical protein
MGGEEQGDHGDDLHLFIGQGNLRGIDTTTAMVGRWRSLEGGLAKIFSLPRIDSDAREIGRGSEMV